MEKNLLKLFKLVDTLHEIQNEVYAQIEYCADHTKKLAISIRRTKDFSYIEKCEIMLLNNPIPKLDAIIKIFENYIGGANNE